MEQEQRKKTKEMDMLQGGLAGKLIVFALPVACSSILQQLFNSADVAVVGRFAGDNALAAVGSCVALVGIFVNLIVGLSIGPNAVLANLIGTEGPREDQLHDAYDLDVWSFAWCAFDGNRYAFCPLYLRGVEYPRECDGAGTSLYPDLLRWDSIYGCL